MEKYYIHLQGTGQKNSVVVIDKKFEVEYNDIGKYTSGITRKEYIQKALDFHYPGLTSHNVTWARVITEKAPKNPDAFEKFIAGVATGAIATKITEPKKQKSVRNQNSVSNTISFVKDLKKYSEMNFSGKDENEIKFLLNQIYNSIADYKWENTGQDEKENKIIKENNRVLNMCLRNYGVGLKYLQNISDNTVEIEEFTKLYKKIKRKRAMNKYGVIVIAIFALIVIMFIIVLLGS